MGLIPPRQLPIGLPLRVCAGVTGTCSWRPRPASACDVCELDYKHQTQPRLRLPSNILGALRAAPNLHYMSRL